AGVAFTGGDVAILIVARLRPETMQGEVGSLKTVRALVAALARARAQFAEGGLPVDREDILGAAIGWRSGLWRWRIHAALGIGGAGATIDLDPPPLRLGAGHDDPEMGRAFLVAGEQVVGRAGTDLDIARIGLAI